MTDKAPERIWRWAVQNSGGWIEYADHPIRSPFAHEYVRADHLKAAVAAEREACAVFCDENVLGNTFHIAEAIRARTDADDLAALEQVKREARRDAIREATEKVRWYIENFDNVTELPTSLLALLDKEPG